MIDSFSITTRLHALGSSIPVGGLDLRPHISAVGRSPVNSVSVDKGSDNTTSSKISVNPPFRSLLFGGGKQGGDVVLVEREEGSVGNDDEFEGQNGNWVSKILHVRSLWSSEQRQGSSENFTSSSLTSCCDDHEGCSVYGYDDGDGDEKGEIRFDRDSFSKLLKKVHINEAKLYSQMSYLANLAYSIPSIEPGNRLKRHSLRFVTSSIEKREQLALAETNEQQSIGTKIEGNESEVEELNYDGQKETQKSLVTTSVAFRIAASAASYLQNHTTTLLPFRSPKKEGEGDENVDDGNLEFNSEMASLMATTDSVTAVVAAKEEVKQAVADDLSSISSSPCEWYICDDEKSATRFFVIQGSETLASWQANLLFEPVKFEGLDVFVHRGIYEAAKGMYQQMLPEVHAHIKAHGGRAKFRFTGHSLGGSLSLLINLMLLVRGEVPYSSLLPVITFGSPCIMCGGDGLLSKLGLPKSHVQAIVMHRDIVPRAFSCIYPMPATELLKAMNRNFRNHPCLNNQNLLYAPMGETLILQPDDKYSPHHDLLPSGSGLYLLTSNAHDDAKESEQQLRAAMNAFLNNPHPLETLSDRSAYGHGGSIQRDHDMNSYLKCLRSVIRQELSRMRKAERDRRRKVWWAPLVEARAILGPSNVGRAQFNFLGIVRSGRESVKRFSRFIASQHMHLLVLVLFPVRLLLMGTFRA